MCDDIDLLNNLDDELSYKIMGSEFSKAAKGYYNDFGDFIRWDGKKHLLQQDGRFPSGLYNRVLDFLSKEGIVPDIEDARHEPLPATPIDILPRLKEMNKYPRPYQLEIAEVASRYDRGIIKASTGSGKTNCMALITANLGRSAIIFVIGTDLLYQTHKVFTDIFQKEIGIIGDGNCEIRDINIASIWTIGKVLGTKDAVSLADSDDKEKEIAKEKYSDIKQMLNSASTVIFDECQLVGCDTTLEIARNLGKNLTNLYGMSASPWRDDGADLLIESVLGKRIIDLSARHLIDQGYLVEPIIRFLAPSPYPFKKGQFQKVYQKYIVENEMVVKATLKMIEQGFLPLVLFNSIKHGDILYEKLKGKTSVALLSGKDSSKVREQIKKDIADGKIKCIIASKIFDAGVDLPALSGLIIASAGKSSIKALQRIGRVIRTYPNKKIAAVIDFCDQAPYLFNHSVKRKEIYETEFNVQWPNAITSKKVVEDLDSENKD
jgi:superfamily II DNA or RNA helicase